MIKKLLLKGLILLLSFLCVLVAQADQSTLAGSWRLVKFQSMDDTQPLRIPAPELVFDLHLFKDGRFSMQLDCNRAMGEWRVDPRGEPNSGSFSFSQVASTRALCRPPNLDEWIIAQAEFVRSFQIKQNRLYLNLMADAGTFIWERLAASPDLPFTYVHPDQGGPRAWQIVSETGLNLREAPSISAPVRLALTPNTVLDNLGCTERASQFWCDVQPLGGGPRGYVAAQFLKPAVSPDGLAYFGAHRSAYRAGLGMYDASGVLKCARADGLLGDCDFEVARDGGGFATVRVVAPGGSVRHLFFRLGRAIGVSSAEADYPGLFVAVRSGDLTLIQVGDERYQVPDAVVLGG